MILLNSFLLILYRISTLLKNNFLETTLIESCLIFSVFITFSLFTFFLTYIFIRNKEKSDLITLLATIMFFGFGSLFSYDSWVFQTLRTIPYIKFFIHFRYLVPLWITVFFIFTYFLKKSNANTFLNKLFFYILATLTIFSFYELLPDITNIIKTKILHKNVNFSSYTSKYSYDPDIYYIVLDGYARQDVLQELSNFDNSPFLSELEQLGFVINRKSCSNYNVTELSIPSTICMNYLNKQNITCMNCWNQSDMIALLKQHHYFFINVSSNYGFTTHITQANINIGKSFYNNFFIFCLKKTILSPFIDICREKYGYDHFSKKILHQINSLSEIPLNYQFQSPLFVFCHILYPHEPPLFEQNGNLFQEHHYFYDIYSKKDRSLYIVQIEIINKLILNTIKKILSLSKKPPIIILQSDHGSRHIAVPIEDCIEPKIPENLLMLKRERLSNLSALYFPNGGDKKIYQGMTNVNTFRILFDYYFGTHFGLLPDLCYWQNGKNIHSFCYTPDEINNFPLIPVHWNPDM